MQLHHFDPNTRVFTHTAKALLNPQAPGEFFKQAFATADPLPMLNTGEVARRDSANTGWLITEDHRGPAWHTDTKQKIQISEYGPLPENYTQQEPGEWDIWQEGRWQPDEAARLKHVKQLATEQLQQLLDNSLQTTIGSSSHYQTATWDEKARRAERVLRKAATATDLEILQLEASKRNREETTEQLAARQYQKAALHQRRIALLDGIRSAAQRDINNAETIAELEALQTRIQAKIDESLTSLVSQVTLPEPDLIVRSKIRISQLLKR